MRLTAVAFALLVGLAVSASSAADRAGETSGSLIAFERQRCTYDDPGETCYSAIWAVDVATGRERLLARSGHDPAWSPDGRRIAFVDDTDYDLWVMNADGSAKRRLTRLRGLNLLEDPAWSPDGRRIAFGGLVGSGLSVVNTDGTGLRRVARMPAGADRPSWSPSGDSIAFHTPAFGRDEMYVVDASGKHRRRLVSGAGFGPVWSPAGDEIAFGPGPDSRRPGDLYLVNADGSRLRRLTRGDDGATEPAWSHDGRMLAFRTYGSDIYVVNRDGTGLRRIGESSFHGAAWSPKAQTVAYSTGKSLFLVNANGTGRRKITTRSQGDYDSTPAWQP